MVNQKKPRILALDPGTRYLGFAVLHGHELLYHGVKVLPQRRNRALTSLAARRAVSEIIQHLQPSVLALEDSFHSRTKRMAAQVALVRTLRTLGHKNGLTTVSYAPSTVRKFLCGSGWAGKRDVAIMVTLKYPELRPYVVRERQWKERFHGHMFDAVAVGLLALSKLRRR